MTFIVTPQIPLAQEQHDMDLWTKAECYRFYVTERRVCCTFLERMNLWLRAPYCEECILSHSLQRYEIPDITPGNWENDIAWKLGDETLDIVKTELADDSDFSFRCKRCFKTIAPWNGNAVHIVNYHLEEHYGIPLYTPNRKNPPVQLRKQIFKLYGNTCFACGKTGPGLHIDHIVPQSHGGDAAFRNLQLLCSNCGQKKGDSLPADVDVWSNIYFGHAPSDGYEGLFW